MKKFLSLVLALVMTMSLVTVSAGAQDFNDSDELSGEQYEEAVNVMSEMGIIDGYSDGDFRPQGTLTRGAAAKIIACMMLGKTTAEALGTSAAPFKDVPVGSTFAGYIAYCVESGLIDGYADGTFRPQNTLTGFAFLKMLLTALGYDSTIEGYTGPNWTVNVMGRATQIGLIDGNDEFVGNQSATREEACLYAVNALKATLVEYESKGTNVTVNGATVAIGASKPTYVTSSIAGAATSIDATIDNTTHDYTVEFAEKYQPDLELTHDTDDFMRPAHTWSWKDREIGTYVDYDKMVAEYTTSVTGREVYEVLTSTTIRDNDLLSYVDGDDGSVEKDDLVRSNKNDLDATGNGVLTQVFVDTDRDEITIASVNTYLAKANADYSENSETASLNVYIDDADGETRTVDVEDVAEAADVTEDTFYLVNMSKKDVARGEVVAINDVEVLEDSTVTKFSKDDTLVVDKLTVDGTEYNAAEKAFYDKDTLDEYDEGLLTDMSYNVYLDQYGYAIGVDLYEGTLNYVFITGYDRGSSHISIKTADAAAIFVDGNMDTITVNVTDTNKNIDKLDGKDENDAGNNPGDGKYYAQWSTGEQALNRWYSYTVNESGVYTLKPVGDGERMFVTDLKTNPAEIINCSNVRLDDGKYDNGRAYGNDNSVYITAEAGHVDESAPGKDDAITEVTGVYTGVQNVDIEMTADAKGDVAEANVYTLFDSDRYIIASIVLGEAQGSIANYAYILSGAKSEERVDGTYYWEFDAVLGGEVQTLTARSKYPSTISDLDVGTVQELRFDGDYVVSVKDIPASDIYNTTKYNASTKIDDEEVYFVSVNNVSRGDVLELEGRTLYSSSRDVGLTLVSDAKAVVIQDENNKTDVKTSYASVREAIAALGDPSTAAGKQYVGDIIAVLNSQGVAEWVVFDSATPVNSGSDDGYVDVTSNILSAEANRNTMTVSIEALETATVSELRNAVVRALQEIGYDASFVTVDDSTGANSPTWTGTAMAMRNGNMGFFSVEIDRVVTITIDGKVVQTLPVNAENKTIDMGDYADNGGTGFLVQRAPGAGYNEYFTYDDDFAPTERPTSMDIKTGYVKVTGTAVDEDYVLAGSVTLTFNDRGSYKISASDMEDMFVTVEDGDTVYFTTEEDITVASYTFPADAVESAAETAGISDGTKTLESGKGTMTVNLAAGTVSLKIAETITAWDNFAGADTNLVDLATALLTGGYSIRISCDGEATTLSGSVELTDITRVLGDVPTGDEVKTVNVVVLDDDGNSASYTVTISVAE